LRTLASGFMLRLRRLQSEICCSNCPVVRVIVWDDIVRNSDEPRFDGTQTPPCSISGVSYAAPSSGYVNYSQTVTGCTNSPWGARLEAYFWDGGWWQIILYDQTNAYYSRTLYSAAVEGWHQIYWHWSSPYIRYAYTYAREHWRIGHVDTYEENKIDSRGDTRSVSSSSAWDDTSHRLQTMSMPTDSQPNKATSRHCPVLRLTIRS